MGWEAQEDGYLAAVLQPDGAKDIAVGTPVAVIVEDKVRHIHACSLHVGETDVNELLVAKGYLVASLLLADDDAELAINSSVDTCLFVVLGLLCIEFILSLTS